MIEAAPLQAAVPVFTIDGDVKGELARDLTRLEIEEDTAGLRHLRAQFLAWGPTPTSDEEGRLYLDGRMLDFGKGLKASIGPTGGDRTLFDGVISAIEIDVSENTPGEVVVMAEDRLMDLRMTRRSRTYENMSDEDIARRIASDHGLTPQVSAPGPTYDVVQQWNMSDLAFLRERGRLVQAEVWADDRTLGFEARTSRRATAVTLTLGENLVNARIRADLAHQRTSINVSGYDAQSRALIDEEAPGSVIQQEASGGRTGPSVLSQAFGDRKSFRVREVPLTSSEARDWAKAEMLRRARQFVVASGTALGVPDLVVGTELDLRDVGAPFEGGSYYVTRMRHIYDIRFGHRTQFEAERGWIGQFR